MEDSLQFLYVIVNKHAKLVSFEIDDDSKQVSLSSEMPEGMTDLRKDRVQRRIVIGKNLRVDEIQRRFTGDTKGSLGLDYITTAERADGFYTLFEINDIKGEIDYFEKLLGTREYTENPHGHQHGALEYFFTTTKKAVITDFEFIRGITLKITVKTPVEYLQEGDVHKRLIILLRSDVNPIPGMFQWTAKKIGDIYWILYERTIDTEENKC